MTDRPEKGHPSQSTRAGQIQQIIDEYLDRRAQDTTLSVEGLFIAHPQLMPELAEELRKVQIILGARRRAEGLGSKASDGSKLAQTAAVSFDGQAPSDSVRSLHVRCPHCHHRAEVDLDSPLADLSCSVCGKDFSLVDGTSSSETGSTLKSIAHFDLIEPLGHGSFGTVWKARDTHLDRLVAVKIPRKDRLDAVEAEQFFREARAAAQLRHPNIVSVHEVGRDNDTAYIVSDFVRGVTLSEWLTAHLPSPREAATLCGKIAEALHHAHQAGVVHRDLKPGNVMLDADNQPHIMDFGLAKREMGESRLTAEGRVLGTPAYMSPEQARGEAYRVDRRTDVYSLGVILFELLTGEIPFRGNAAMLTLQILHDDPPSPRKLNGQVPRDLETVTLKCLEKDPHRRYATIQEVADELHRYLRGEPILARPLGRGARAWRWCRRKPLIASLSGSLILLLLAVAIAGPLVALHQNALRREADQARSAVELTLSDMSASFGLIAGQRGDRAQAVLWFANAARLARHDADRARANRIRVHTFSRDMPLPLRALSHQGERLQQMLFHPRSRHLLSLTASGKCTIWDLQDEKALDALAHHRPVTSAVWSPDGGALVLGTADGSVEIHGFPEIGRSRRLTHPGAVTALAISADGRLLAAASDRLHLWDLHTHQRLPFEAHHPGPVVQILFDDANRRIVTACADAKVRVFGHLDRGGRAEPLFDPIPNLPHIKPALLAEKQALVTVNSSGSVELRDGNTGQRIALEEGSSRGPNDVRAIRVSPNGEYVVVCRFPEAQVLYLSYSESYLSLFPCQLVLHLNRVMDAAFSPDSRTLLTASLDRTAKLVRIDSFQRAPSEESAAQATDAQEKSIGHQAEVTAAACSPDGRLWATAQADGLVRIWSPGLSSGRSVPLDTSESHVELGPDGGLMLASGWRRERGLTNAQVFSVASGKPIGPRIAHEGLINAAFFAPDGRRLITLSSLKENAHRRAWPHVQLDRQPGWIHYWRWPGAERQLPPTRTTSEPMGGGFSPDGRLLVVVCAAGEVLWIDPQSGSLLGTLHHGGTAQPGALPCRWLQFAPDGQTFVTWGLGSTVCLWDRQSQQLRHPLQAHTSLCRCAAFSADGRWLVTGAEDRSAIVWDVASGKPAAPPLRHPDWVFSACFSPDGRQVLTGCRDHMARLWDWQAGSLAGAPLEHDDEVYDARFSPDGCWVFTTSRDKTTRAWQWQTGQPVTPSWALAGPGYQLVLTPDGRYAVTAGAMASLQVFDLADLAEANPQEFDLVSLHLLGEILSGRRIHEGGGTINLTSAEWLQSWRAFRQRNPECPMHSLGAPD